MEFHPLVCFQKVTSHHLKYRFKFGVLVLIILFLYKYLSFIDMIIVETHCNMSSWKLVSATVGKCTIKL